MQKSTYRVANMVEIRPEQDGDAAAIRGVLTSAFPTQEEADLVDALRDNSSVWEPGLSYLAHDGDKVIGHVLLTRCWINSTPALALAPVAVVPDYQGRGFGSALIEKILDDAAASAHEVNAPAAVLVLGSAEFYPRFGFEISRMHGIKPPFDVPKENFMVLNLNPEFELPMGMVYYPAEFGIDDEEDF